MWLTIPIQPRADIQLSTYDRPCGITRSERVPTTPPPNQAASGGAPAFRSVNEVARTTWPARNRSAPARTPQPGVPADQQVLNRRAGADLAARLLDRSGRRTGQHVGHGAVEGPMRSLGRRCRVRSAARTERVRVALGRLRHESWVQRGAPTSYLVRSHAHSVTGSSGSEPATSCQEALSERACDGVADTHEPRSKRSATGSGVGRAPSMARMSSSQEQETPACLARGQAQLSTAQCHPPARARMAGSHAALGIVARK